MAWVGVFISLLNQPITHILMWVHIKQEEKQAINNAEQLLQSLA